MIRKLTAGILSEESPEDRGRTGNGKYLVLALQIAITLGASR